VVLGSRVSLLLIIVLAASFLSSGFIMDNFALPRYAFGGSSPTLPSLLAPRASSAPPLSLVLPGPALVPACRFILPLAEQLLVLASDAAASPLSARGGMFVMLRPPSPSPPSGEAAGAV
jgi:hypothetical protein